MRLIKPRPGAEVVDAASDFGHTPLCSKSDAASSIYRSPTLRRDDGAAALEAAGIKPIWLPGPEGTLAERVESAKRMSAAGESTRAIADALGVTPWTANRYLRAHPCRTCRDPVVGKAKLCQACSTRQGNPKRWSKQELVAAVHKWVLRRKNADSRRLAARSSRRCRAVGCRVPRVAAR